MRLAAEPTAHSKRNTRSHNTTRCSSSCALRRSSMRSRSWAWATFIARVAASVGMIFSNSPPSSIEPPTTSGSATATKAS